MLLAVYLEISATGAYFLLTAFTLNQLQQLSAKENFHDFTEEAT